MQTKRVAKTVRYPFIMPKNMFFGSICLQKIKIRYLQRGVFLLQYNKKRRFLTLSQGGNMLEENNTNGVTTTETVSNITEETPTNTPTVEEVKEKKLNATEKEVALETLTKRELSSKATVQINAMRLGTALSNLGMALLVCSALCFLGTMIFPLLVGINFVIAIVIVIVTLGLILLKYPFSTFIIFNLNSAGEFAPILFQAMSTLSLVALVVSAISLISLIVGGKKVNSGRLICTVVVILLSLVFALMKTGGV